MSFPHRVAGNIALDLANTVSWRGTERETDHLATAAAVWEWARQSGLVKDGFDLPSERSGVLLAQVRTLRSGIADVGTAIAQGDEVPRTAVTVIRDLAAQTLQRADLAGLPAALAFQGADRIVGAIAWAALDLLRGDELPRLKQCPPNHCRWLFVDRTKNGSRRWCDMGTCGNRAKKLTLRHGG